MANQDESNTSLGSLSNTQNNLSAKLWLNQRLAAAELMKPSPPLDKFAHELTINLWLETLEEIGEERFDAALKAVLKTSTFRPDIAEIRKFAGIPVVYPVEREAKDELARLIPLLRHHGRKLTNRGNPPKDPPLPLPHLLADVIADFGFGDIRAGLEAIWAHPALDLVRDARELDELESFRAVAGEKIERKWVEFYTRRKAEGFKRVAA